MKCAMVGSDEGISLALSYTLMSGLCRPVIIEARLGTHKGLFE